MILTFNEAQGKYIKMILRHILPLSCKPSEQLNAIAKIQHYLGSKEKEALINRLNYPYSNEKDRKDTKASLPNCL